MAQRTEIILIDDIDGDEATETIEFGLDGVTYEIDLSEKNADRLRAAFEEWVENGRRTGGKKKKGGVASVSSSGASSSSSSDRRAHLAGLRAWAKDNGYQVSARGRVPADIEAKYQAYLAG